MGNNFFFQRSQSKTNNKVEYSRDNNKYLRNLFLRDSKGLSINPIEYVNCVINFQKSVK
ncbi:hypothetical protein M153_1774000174, partial [Pseudoloma neurophilia]